MEDGSDASEYFAKLGSNCNAYTSFKVTCYEVYAYNNFKENLNYLLDYVQTPCYNEKIVEAEKGIIICGTGIGISIAANKVKGIRCALCTNEYMAKMSRMHNNANMLALGGRVTGVGLALEMVDVWLSTEFEGGRHENRVNKIMDIEITKDEEK